VITSGSAQIMLPRELPEGDSRLAVSTPEISKGELAATRTS
jgi:hypothetical protein